MRQSPFIVAAVLLLLLAAAYCLFHAAEATQADAVDRAIAELEQAPAEQVPVLLRQLARNHPQPEELLGRCLRGRHPVLIEAAEAELAAELASWQELPRPRAAQRMIALLDSLAADVPQMSPAGQRAARQLARQALRWPTLPGSRETPQLLASCQRMLTELDRQDMATGQEPIRLARETEDTANVGGNKR